MDDNELAKRDAEELIEIFDVSLDEWQKLILQGKVALPSVQTTLMARDYLDRNG